MNDDFVKPFFDATVNVLTTMAQTEAKQGDPSQKEDNTAKGDVSGIIKMVGSTAKCSVAVSFSESAILHIASKMLGEKVDNINETITDVVGEIASMIAGGARKTLIDKGCKLDMGVPSTLTGNGHTISHNLKGAVMILPFSTSAGEFFVEICFEM